MLRLQALYEHCESLGKRVVLVLSKVHPFLIHSIPVALAYPPTRPTLGYQVDLVELAHVERWKGYLSARFPNASIVEFSSRGRAPGGTTGGVNARRKVFSVCVCF